MLAFEHPRDLVMIGAIFGVAAFAWSGWAQEQPPRLLVWRIVLGALSVLGLALAAVSITFAVQNWSAGSAFDTKGAPFVVYTIVFWIEVAAIIGLSIWAMRAGRSDLIAPLILLVIGVHFLPLAWVFGQPLLFVVGVVLSVAAVIAGLMGATDVARSFWCGIVAAPVLLAAGTWSALAGFQALRS